MRLRGRIQPPNTKHAADSALYRRLHVAHTKTRAHRHQRRNYPANDVRQRPLSWAEGGSIHFLCSTTADKKQSHAASVDIPKVYWCSLGVADLIAECDDYSWCLYYEELSSRWLAGMGILTEPHEKQCATATNSIRYA
ncbi:unnamed protein product [Alternaria burnsii]|nr:unnamed protein product [Alternaria burnsii]